MPDSTNFYVDSASDKFLDSLTDADYLARKLPGMAEQFQSIRSLQDRYWDMRKVSSHGSIVGGAGDMKHVASIPKDVWLAAEACEPELTTNPAVFYAWLRRNPEYSTRKHG